MLTTLKTFLPSKAPLLIAAAGAAVMVLGFFLSLAMGLDPNQDTRVASGLGGFALFSALPFCVALGVAGALERRDAPSALLYGVGALGSIPGGIIMGVAMGIDAGASTGLFGGACCFGVPFFAMAIPGTLAALRAPESLRAELLGERRAAATRLLAVDGVAELDAIARATSMPSADAAAMVQEMIREGVIDATLDEDGGRLFANDVLSDRAERLLAAIRLEGRVDVPAVTRELEISAEQLKALLYQADRDGLFTGYVDWQGGVVYSRDASALRSGARCPSCGGELQLAGRGLVRCEHCGAEIYL